MPISANDCCQGVDLIGHTRLLNAPGPGTMEVWFCPEETSVLIPEEGTTDAGWWSNITFLHQHLLRPGRCTCGRGYDGEHPCPQGADIFLGEIPKASKLTNVFKITNYKNFCERHRRWTEIENTLTRTVREEVTFKLRQGWKGTTSQGEKNPIGSLLFPTETRRTNFKKIIDVSV